MEPDFWEEGRKPRYSLPEPPEIRLKNETLRGGVGWQAGEQPSVKCSLRFFSADVLTVSLPILKVFVYRPDRPVEIGPAEDFAGQKPSLRLP